MAESIFDLQSELCRTLSSANRLRILHTLRQGPLSVGEIARETEMSHAHVSQHLAVLRAQDVVRAERAGTSVVYHITNPKVALICDLMREILADQAADRASLIKELKRPRARA